MKFLQLSARMLPSRQQETLKEALCRLCRLHLFEGGSLLTLPTTSFMIKYFNWEVWHNGCGYQLNTAVVDISAI
jgi:hypothetical protein